MTNHPRSPLCNKERLIDGAIAGWCGKPSGHISDCFTGCESCDHADTIPVSESALDWAHGFVRKLCRCCLLAESRKMLAEITETVAKRSAELESKPCR
jgi:hypothetical protein